MLQHILLENFTTTSGKTTDIPLSYQIFGQPLFSAPIVLVNHALTGNSDVAGNKGWWKDVVGDHKTIDTQKYTVICFNIPGNGFDDFLIDDFEDFTAKDIATIFIAGLDALKISSIDYLIGGSVGGAIGWEMLAQKPDLAKHLIPVATDFKTSDWLFAQCLVQKFLLENPDKPLQKARAHAMLCYRTPKSLNLRFNREKLENGTFKSHDWLNYHGKALTERFSLKAYRLMNHLLMNIDADPQKIKKISADIHLVSVDSDLFFPAFEIKKTFEEMKQNSSKIYYHEIHSIHGHDAFLMEYDQLTKILKTIFN